MSSESLCMNCGCELTVENTTVVRGLKYCDYCVDNGATENDAERYEMNPF